MLSWLQQVRTVQGIIISQTDSRQQNNTKMARTKLFYHVIAAPLQLFLQIRMHLPTKTCENA